MDDFQTWKDVAEHQHPRIAALTRVAPRAERQGYLSAYRKSSMFSYEFESVFLLHQKNQAMDEVYVYAAECCCRCDRCCKQT
jgi:hypothetical protein